MKYSNFKPLGVKNSCWFASVSCKSFFGGTKEKILVKTLNCQLWCFLDTGDYAPHAIQALELACEGQLAYNELLKSNAAP